MSRSSRVSFYILNCFLALHTPFTMANQNKVIVKRRQKSHKQMYANCANRYKCESTAEGLVSLVLKIERYAQRLTRVCSAWGDSRISPTLCMLNVTKCLHPFSSNEHRVSPKKRHTNGDPNSSTNQTIARGNVVLF